VVVLVGHHVPWPFDHLPETFETSLALQGTYANALGTEQTEQGIVQGYFAHTKQRPPRTLQ